MEQYEWEFLGRLRMEFMARSMKLGQPRAYTMLSGAKTLAQQFGTVAASSIAGLYKEMIGNKRDEI